MNRFVPSSLQWLLPSLLLCAASSLFGQSRFSISGPDSLAFRCTIDGEEITNRHVTSLTVAGITPGKKTIRVVFFNGTFIEQIIPLKNNFHSAYSISELKGNWRLNLSSESGYTPSEMSGLPETLAQVSVASPEIVDSVSNPGCPAPCSANDFERLKKELQDTRFQTARFEQMKAFCAANCLRVDQLRYLLAVLETEDQKLRLLEIVIGRIYDTERLSSIEDDFFLEKTKEKVRHMLGNVAAP